MKLECRRKVGEDVANKVAGGASAMQYVTYTDYSRLSAKSRWDVEIILSQIMSYHTSISSDMIPDTAHPASKSLMLLAAASVFELHAATPR